MGAMYTTAAPLRSPPASQRGKGQGMRINDERRQQGHARWGKARTPGLVPRSVPGAAWLHDLRRAFGRFAPRGPHRHGQRRRGRPAPATSRAGTPSSQPPWRVPRCHLIQGQIPTWELTGSKQGQKGQHAISGQGGLLKLQPAHGTVRDGIPTLACTCRATQIATCCPPAASPRCPCSHLQHAGLAARVEDVPLVVDADVHKGCSRARGGRSSLEPTQTRGEGQNTRALLAMHSGVCKLPSTHALRALEQARCPDCART